MALEVYDPKKLPKTVNCATIKETERNIVGISSGICERPPISTWIKNNLFFVSYLEDKGDKVIVLDGKVLVWLKGSGINNARVIGIHDGILYKLVSQSNQALLHDEIDISDL